MIPSRGTLPVTPRRPTPLRVICLHPGLGHSADFHECLVALTAEFNKVDDFGLEVALAWSDVVLPPPDSKQPFSSAECAKWLSQVKARCDILICIPLYFTLSRARHGFSGGPAPLRSSTWSRCLPNLFPLDGTAVDNGNTIADFCLQALDAAASSGT